MGEYRFSQHVAAPPEGELEHFARLAKAEAAPHAPANAGPDRSPPA
jgi:hypothetical protein